MANDWVPDDDYPEACHFCGGTPYSDFTVVLGPNQGTYAICHICAALDMHVKFIQGSDEENTNG